MGEFLRVLLDSIQFLWPLRLVHEWERAGYYICGKFWREMGPGLKIVVPWFTEVHAVSVASDIISTPRQDITLGDGATLSFSVKASARVVDVNKAVNNVGNFKQSTQELIEGVLADKLADVAPERLKPEKRRRLLSDLTRMLQEEAAEFGVEVSRLRFNNFILNVPTIRLLQEQEAAGW